MSTAATIAASGAASARRGGEPPPAWTPAELFAGTEVGGWYDPSDIATLFQDTAGTVPVTANGQTVGRMLDKSGNGIHLIGDTGTVTYQDGALQFGGSANMQAVIALTGSEAAFALACNSGGKPGSTEYWFCGGNHSTFGVIATYVTATADVYGGNYTDGAGGSCDVVGADPGVDMSEPHVLTTRNVAGLVSLDGATEAGDPGTANWGGITRLTLGCVRLDSGPFGYASGLFYGGVFRTTEWNDTEDAQLSAWLAP